MRLLDKLSAWGRSALVFSLVWLVLVTAVLLYEKYVTIGSRAGKYAALFDYNTLIFYGVYRSGADISFWLQLQKVLDHLTGSHLPRLGDRCDNACGRLGSTRLSFTLDAPR